MSYSQQSWKARTSQQAYKARVRARAKHLPATLAMTEWRATLRGFGNGCAYCAITIKNPRIPDLDLFVPMHLNGGATHNNCLPMCRRCRYAKGKCNPFEGTFWERFPNPDQARDRVTAFLASVGGATAPTRPSMVAHFQRYFEPLCGDTSVAFVLVGNRKAVTCTACLELLEE